MQRLLGGPSGLLAQTTSTLGSGGPGSDLNASGQANSAVGLAILVVVLVLVVVGGVLIARQARARRPPT